MPRQLYDYDPPERFVAGTVGEPGGRTFFLQARTGARLTSVALEKAQVAVLAERVEELLDEVIRRTAGAATVLAAASEGTDDTAALEAPIEEEFRVGTMSLAWDTPAERVIVECFDADTDAEAEEDGPETDGAVLRVHLTGGAARAFVKRAKAVVAAGRPPCPFCAGPLDPAGHVCPRANGYRR